jgi:hypothetical protein
MSFNLADLDLSTFTDDASRFSFAVINCRPELLTEGNGFHIIDQDAAMTISNIEWEGDGPETPLTDAEVAAKVAELFPEV